MEPKQSGRQAGDGEPETRGTRGASWSCRRTVSQLWRARFHPSRWVFLTTSARREARPPMEAGRVNVDLQSTIKNFGQQRGRERLHPLPRNEKRHRPAMPGNGDRAVLFRPPDAPGRLRLQLGNGHCRIHINLCRVSNTLCQAVTPTVAGAVRILTLPPDREETAVGRDRRARRPVVCRAIGWSRTARSRGRGIPTNNKKYGGSIRMHLIQRKPHRFALQPHLNARLLVFGLIKNELGFRLRHKFSPSRRVKLDPVRFHFQR